jgi:hypothetical protein
VQYIHQCAALNSLLEGLDHSERELAYRQRRIKSDTVNIGPTSETMRVNVNDMEALKIVCWFDAWFSKYLGNKTTWI